ncbi:hypothetical protein [Holdemanella biformis]
MKWINIFGVIFTVIIIIPNNLYTIKIKDGFENKWNNKLIEIIEQLGRFGCLEFMIINISGTWFGWWSDEAFAIYLIVNIILITLFDNFIIRKRAF